MRSAFRQGIDILNEPESNSARKVTENPSKSASKYAEGINWVPKNATQLELVIDKLMQKVIMYDRHPTSLWHLANAT